MSRIGNRIITVPAGVTKLKYADDVADAAKATTNDVMKNRVKLRKGTKETIKEVAPKTREGLFIDPNTNLPIEKGQEVFGHGISWTIKKRESNGYDGIINGRKFKYVD